MNPTLGAILVPAGPLFEGDAVALSIGGAVTARWGRRWARFLVLAYVELIRNTPFIVQMFFIFFGLPSLGLRFSALAAAALAMIINLTAYAIELIRAGLDAVPPGQAEAGRSMGLHGLGVFALIVLPQALATVYPALVGQITITMLESAVVSQIAVVDLTHVADLIQSRMDFAELQGIALGVGLCKKPCAFSIGGEHGLDQACVPTRCFLRHGAYPPAPRVFNVTGFAIALAKNEP